MQFLHQRQGELSFLLSVRRVLPFCFSCLRFAPFANHESSLVSIQKEVKTIFKLFQAFPSGHNSAIQRDADKPRPMASAADHFRDATKKVDCAPVTLDLALVKMPDDSRHMIASSPDGEVVAGFDMPVLPTILASPPKWSAGLSYSDQRKVGAWLDRDVGRAVVGVAVRQSDRGLRAEARLGWRF